MSLIDVIKKKKASFNVKIATLLADEQSKCPHNHVGHWDGFSEYSTMHPHRICLECGLEEEGGWWCYSINCSHWHVKDHYDKVGKTIPTHLGPKEGRTFKNISFDELMRLRP